MHVGHEPPAAARLHDFDRLHVQAFRALQLDLE
jgi:hypothetical protein